MISIVGYLIFFCLLINIKAEYSCPVRIISNNAHSSASFEEDDVGSSVITDQDYGGLPEGGENMQPLANNTGFISSEQSIRKNYKW